MAVIAVKALDNKKAENIKLLRVSDVTVVADYFAICTGTSNTHIKTLCDEVEKTLKEAGEEPGKIEGYRSGTWVLLDFGCLVVHVFTDETRKFYNLERLWSDADEVRLDEVLA